MSDLISKAQALREAFDHSFSLPPPAAPEAPENLLAVRIGSDRYALRTRELAGLQLLRRVTPLPGARRGLLGLTGVRGRLVPVFSLAQLLGQAQTEAPRWLVICGAEEPMGLAFGELEGHHSPPRSSLSLLPEAESQPHLRQTVRLGGSADQPLSGHLYPVLDLAALIQRIQAN